MVTMNTMVFLIVLFFTLSLGSAIGILVTAFLNASDDNDYDQMMEDDGK